MTSHSNRPPSKEVNRREYTPVPVHNRHQLCFVSPSSAFEKPVDDTMVKLPLKALDQTYFAGRDFTQLEMVSRLAGGFPTAGGSTPSKFHVPSVPSSDAPVEPRWAIRALAGSGSNMLSAL
jgi:hypothetical protein